ncbi:hypothetical protein RhiirA4_528450 [Rhizophagus irregularis]|uniref:Uncharacterized protein n=1 Tax=Rhizophagus irregularis TaxID=588596 RepID=A0A2I1GT65_9GLOM|nr:hypothetical protein RhiirA4_528450 [Rhizophagus irregularis]
MNLVKLQGLYWTAKCIGEKNVNLRKLGHSYVNDSLKMLRDNGISICDHELIMDNYKCHRYLGGCHELIDIFSEKKSNEWKVQLKKKKILFLDQIIEHDKEYLMKWQHFLGFINYGGGEPLWYKRLKKKLEKFKNETSNRRKIDYKNYYSIKVLYQIISEEKLQVNWSHDEFEDISDFNVKIEGMKKEMHLRC